MKLSFTANTPEEAARRRFGLWALGLMIVFLPPWWFLGADLLAAALRPLVELVGRLFGLGAITPGVEGWSFATPLTRQGQAVAFETSDNTIRRMLLAVPVTAALLLAPPRPALGWRAPVIGLAVIAVVFCFSMVGFVWGELAGMLSPEPGASTGRLDQPPLSPLVRQLALLSRYLAFAVAPLVTAVLLWAAFSPEARRTLLGAFDTPDTPPER